MKILIFLGFHNPVSGAAWTRIDLIAKKFAKKGTTGDILGAFSPVPIAGDVRYKNVSKVQDQFKLFNIVPTIGLSYKIPIAFLFNLLMSFFVSLFWLLIRRPDIVIASLPPGDSGLGFVLASLFMRKKIIIDHRDEWDCDCCISSVTDSKTVQQFYSAIVRPLTSVIYRHALAIATVTHGFESSIRSRGCKNVLFIPNGADTSIFRPFHNKPNSAEFKIIYVGMIGYYYHFDDFIVALKSLADHGIKIKFVLVGQGNELRNIMALASKLNLQDSIECHGVLRMDELAKVVARADIGIVPSIYSVSHLPVKFFEYCACGLPVVVVASENSELSKLVIENKVGLICKPHDSQALTNALGRLCLDDTFRISSSKNARLFVKQHFDRDKINEELFDFIKRLVAKG